ncbi:MAG: TfoX/Sxy family protein [Planctomycetota bacterium]|jgi:DNA transformation protein
MPKPIPEFLEFVLGQLEQIEGLRYQRMFGGFGLYDDETFFAIVADDRLYLKTSDATRPNFIERGMGPFVATPKITLKTYYEAPAGVIEQPGLLTEWARDAITAKLTEK